MEMHGLDGFVDECRAAVGGANPSRDVAAAMSRLMGRLDDLDLPQAIDRHPVMGGEDELHVDNDLTVLLVHTPPGHDQPPHDHTMTAVIGVYAGCEAQRLYRKTPDGPAPIELTGTKDLRAGDTISLGANAVHAIAATDGQWAHAVHVYLGPLLEVDRSLFDPDTLEETAFTTERYLQWCRPV